VTLHRPLTNDILPKSFVYWSIPPHEGEWREKDNVQNGNAKQNTCARSTINQISKGTDEVEDQRQHVHLSREKKYHYVLFSKLSTHLVMFARGPLTHDRHHARNFKFSMKVAPNKGSKKITLKSTVFT